MTRRKLSSTDPLLWRRLKVGDRIRLVHLPTEFCEPGYLLDRDTLRAYRRLLARNRPLRVCRIDEFGLPWVRVRFRMADGRWEYHSLAVNHDGFVLV